MSKPLLSAILMCVVIALTGCAPQQRNLSYMKIGNWTDEFLCLNKYTAPQIVKRVDQEKRRRGLACLEASDLRFYLDVMSNEKLCRPLGEQKLPRNVIEEERRLRGLKCHSENPRNANIAGRTNNSILWTDKFVCDNWGKPRPPESERALKAEREARGLTCGESKPANDSNTLKSDPKPELVGILDSNLPQSISIQSRLRLDDGRVFEKASNKNADNGAPLLIISASDVTTDITEVSSTRTSSTKKIGSRQVPNPLYTSALTAYNTALARLSGSAPSNCLAYRPCTAFDFAKTVRHNRLQKAVAEAEKKLNRTPPYKTEDELQNYEYRTVQFQVTKTASIQLAKFEAGVDTGFQGRREIRKSNTFTVAYGISPEDTNKRKSRQYATEEDVERYERAPIDITDELKLSRVSWSPISTRAEALAWTQNKSSSVQQPKSNTTKADVSVTADKRFKSVVIVSPPSGGLGTGFYVAPDIILTAEHVVGDTRFVKLTNYEGEEFDGRVIDRDSQRDLALISTNKAGKPLQIFNGDLLLGSTVEAIGHPKGYSYSITRGVISALRLQSSVVGSRLARQVEFVQSDTPISNGNSGGPLLLGEKVVGVASWIRVDKGAQNLNFSVSANEISAYLAENRIGNTY